MEFIAHLSDLTDKFLISFAAATTASWLGTSSHCGARPSTAHHTTHHLSERITTTTAHTARATTAHTAWATWPATHHLLHTLAGVFRGFTLFSVIGSLLSDFFNPLAERLFLCRPLVGRSGILLSSVFFSFVLCHVASIEARVEKAPGSGPYIGWEG
jgi:hypothetical protein